MRRSEFLITPIIVCLALLMTFTVSVGADDLPGNSGFEESGFPDDFSLENDIDLEIDNELMDSRVRLGGFLEEEFEYGFNKKKHKFSKLRTTLFTKFDAKLTESVDFKVSSNIFYDFSYFINGRNHFPEETLEDNEYELELRDLYADLQLKEWLSLKIGRQIIAWGESNYSRITDVVNPRDMTEPGLVDLEDARYPVLSTRLTAVRGSMNYDMVLIHEQNGSKINGLGSDFDYYKSIRTPGLEINNEITPDISIKNTGFAIKINRSFNGADISLVASDTYDKLPVLNLDRLVYEGVYPTGLEVTPGYETYRTYGFAANKVYGGFLFKLEGAYLDDKTLMRSDVLENIQKGVGEDDLETTSLHDQFKLLAGFEYTGISDLTVILEAETTYTLDHVDYLVDEKNEERLFFQSTYNMLNDSFALDLFWIYFHKGNGNILRLSGEYTFIDNLSLMAGVIFYESADETSSVYAYRDQDRVFAGLKYSF